ncbi:arginine--tRNA ligase [Salmonella enterica]|uniref:arginine--tRNA ligase domain-containing protein n=1 Tax=Salmonella enterica TaxID=28901 RepID=UPI003C6FCA41
MHKRAGCRANRATERDEALERARGRVAEKNPDMTADELGKVGNAVGGGGVTDADRSKGRTRD